MRIELPIRTSSPPFKILALWIGSPLTRVPLRLPRSAISMFPSDRRKTQWQRETLGCGLRISFSSPRPTDVPSLEELMWKTFSPDIKKQIETEGGWYRPSEYDDPYPITRNLIEEGRNHLVLGGAIEVGCPVRILQGAQDPDVPWQHAFALTHCLPSDDVVLTLIQDGDHRLSRPQDIARLMAAVAEF